MNHETQFDLYEMSNVYSLVGAAPNPIDFEEVEHACRFAELCAPEGRAELRIYNGQGVQTGTILYSKGK